VDSEAAVRVVAVPSEVPVAVKGAVAIAAGAAVAADTGVTHNC
jgi:hypothetical protein